MHSRAQSFIALITIQELEDAQYQLTLEVNCWRESTLWFSRHAPLLYACLSPASHKIMAYLELHRIIKCCLNYWRYAQRAVVTHSASFALQNVLMRVLHFALHPVNEHTSPPPAQHFSMDRHCLCSKGNNGARERDRSRGVEYNYAFKRGDTARRWWASRERSKWAALLFAATKDLVRWPLSLRCVHIPSPSWGRHRDSCCFASSPPCRILCSHAARASRPGDVTTPPHPIRARILDSLSPLPPRYPSGSGARVRLVSDLHDLLVFSLSASSIHPVAWGYI
jgi:hypothetical protein